jgi:hypothetical protein
MIEISRRTCGSYRRVDQLHRAGGTVVFGTVFDEEPVVSIHGGGRDHDADGRLVDDPGRGVAEDTYQDVVQVLRVVHVALDDAFAIGRDTGRREDFLGAFGIDGQKLTGWNAGSDRGRQ